MTNPVEHKPLDEMLNELTSESTVLVRCVDVVKRFKANERENSFELENFYGFDGDQRWIELGVEEQIRAMLDRYEVRVRGFLSWNIRVNFRSFFLNDKLISRVLDLDWIFRRCQLI